MDLITYFCTSKGFDSLFAIIDRFSKHVTSIPCKATCTAPDLARLFYDHIVCRFSMPKKIVIDSDSRFLSTF